MGSIAATAFFFLERDTVSSGWKTPITVAGVITGVVFMHSMYVRSVWVATGDAPTVYRYIEWFVTCMYYACNTYNTWNNRRKIKCIIK